jgi:gamma-glutamyl:cysteine ligase YbdK (ATP-grasp superfamily)
MTDPHAAPLRLFEATGVELEYMIVDRETLDVRPIADEVLKAVAGSYEQEVEFGNLAWSNELALHVIELKTLDPVARLAGLASLFQGQVARIGEILAPMDAMLLPTAMHPWMDPHRELRLWPHQSDVIYATFNRIFDCRGHGWANLQSTHVNLPFGDDDEFGRLHAAMRLVLPIVPGLAASSPILDGRPSGVMDSRLDVYQHNAARVPSVAGRVIPEAVFTQADYEGRLLQGIYDDLAPLDPEGVLRHEWVNARGAIARFDRGAIEIRLIDAQESPLADVAVAAAVAGLVQALVAERWERYDRQKAWSEDRLAAILADVVRGGDRAVIHDEDYLRALGYGGGAEVDARTLWRDVLDRGVGDAVPEEARAVLDVITTQGCLARRIMNALGGSGDRTRLVELYRRLAGCLVAGTVFEGA